MAFFGTWLFGGRLGSLNFLSTIGHTFLKALLWPFLALNFFFGGGLGTFDFFCQHSIHFKALLA